QETYSFISLLMVRHFVSRNEKKSRDWPLKSSDLEEKEKLTELEFNRLRKLDDKFIKKSRISENAKIFIANKNSRLLRCCTLKS
ncbi:16824_t:CDS:2, partial [Entrophospora sp. SA101]